MDSKVIAALIGLIGISLGSFLGGVGYYLKSRAERQHNKKVVLFHLLEIRHLVKSSFADPKEITKEYLLYCESFFEKYGISGGAEAEVPQEIQVLIETHMSNLLEALRPTIDESFTQSYEASLKDLCKTDPILAFKLNGKERVKELLNAQKEYLDKFSNSITVNSTPPINDLLSARLNTANNNATESLIREINSDISSVARSCSIFTWVSCRRVTRENSKPRINFDELGVEEMFKKMISEFAVVDRS